MKLLVDNNLSYKLIQPLQNLFPGTLHIQNALNSTADDLTVWNFAKTNNFIILTKDNDFDERSQLEGCPPKIIHLICGNKTTLHILNLILWHKDEVIQFCEIDSGNCIMKIS